MIQDIYPSVYDNRYKIASPMADARICAFDGDGVLAKIDAGRIRLPRYEELCAKGVDFCYIFHVDDGDYFLAFCEQPLQVDGYSYLDIRSFLTWNANPDAFSMITAYQLHNWYAKNRFCGRCGAALARGTQERSLVCR